MYYEVIPSRLFRADAGILTYSSDQPLSPGQLVTIPIGKSTALGLVLRKVTKLSFDPKKLKPITTILDFPPLPPHLLHAITWLSDYYLSPLPMILNLILPPKLTGAGAKPLLATLPALTGAAKSGKIPHSGRLSASDAQRREATKWPEKRETRATSPIIIGARSVPDGGILPDLTIPLNPAQKRALTEIAAIKSSTKLLHGITGSGKTNIYLALTLEQYKKHKSTIVLVPEISLTPQLVQNFQTYFKDNVVVLHSKQTDKQRRETWLELLYSNTPKIIIGPRSALFAPIHDLGLIIIDEAHESAYYQENSPHYSALRLASALKKPVLLGTATPLVADYYLAKSHHALIELNQKAKKTTPIKTTIIDFKNRQNFTKNRYFSDQLLANITENLENHHQTLIFHNRRGSAPMTICEQCGWQALCPNCFLPLSLHQDSYTLRCHACGHESKVPTSCPNCNHSSIIHKGFGTKLLESELKKLFKDARIARFDGDNKKSESLDALYNEVKNGHFDIIIGTQTVAKGLDLKNLATVGIVQADSGLSLPDYASEEKTFHLLTQVLGRVGRGHLKTANAIIQTYQPDAPAINYAIQNNYQSFADYLLKKRKKSFLPPYSYLAKLTVTYKTEATVLKHIQSIYRTLRKHLPKNSTLSAPTPAFHERSTRGYTWQLILRSTSRQTLIDLISTLDPKLNFKLTLDPPSLL